MLDGPAEPGRAVGASAEGGGLGSMVWLWAGAAPSTGVSPPGGAALEAAGRLPGAMVPGTDSEVPFICRNANKLPHLQKRKHAIPQTCIQLNSSTIRKSICHVCSMARKVPMGRREWQEAVHLGPHAQHGRLGLTPALLSGHLVCDGFQDGLSLSARVCQVGGVRQDIQMVRPHLLPVLQSGCGKARNG